MDFDAEPHVTDEELAEFNRNPSDAVMPPTSENDAAAQGATVPTSGAEIVPPPEYGPPAPDATDSILAGLSPAQSGIPTRDQDQEQVPAVPREAPGNIGAPAPLPGAPGSVNPATGGVQTETEPDSIAKLREAREAADAAEMKKAEGQEGEVTARAQAAEQRRKNAETVVQREENIQKQYDTADKAAQQQLAQTKAALSQFKFKDYWASKGTAQKVLASLGTALGAMGAGLTGTANYALQILDKDMDRDRQQQVDHLKQLSDDEIRAATGVEDARFGRTRAMADLAVADSHKDKMVAAQLDAAIAKTQDENYRNVLAAQSAKLKERAAASDVDAQNMLRKLNLQQQLDQAKIEEEKARAEKERQQGLLAARGLGQGHKAGGSGHGGSGAALSSAETKVAQQIGDYKAAHGGALPDQGTLYGWADAVKLPHEAKAGHPSLKNVVDTQAKMGTQGVRDQRFGLAVDKDVRTAADDWARSHGVTKTLQTQREYNALQNNIKNAGDNPLQQALAVEKAVSAARGGAASRQALDLALHHLGGSLDSAEGTIQRIRSGGLGEKQWQNFKDFVNTQQGTAQREGKEAFDDYEKFVKDQPSAKQEQFKSERSRLFSGMHGFGGGGGGGEVAAGARKTQGGRTYEFQGGDAKDPSNWSQVQ